MTDEADRASEYEERVRAAVLARRRQILKPCGHCYNCNEPVADLFCDADCLRDFEKRRARDQANGS